MNAAQRHAGVHVLTVLAALALTACGGGSGSASVSDTAAVSSTVTGTQALDAGTTTATTLALDAQTLPDAAASAVALPSFHLAPVLLDDPGEADAIDNTSTAHSAPHTESIGAGQATLETRGLTIQAIQTTMRAQAQSAQRAQADGVATPQAATTQATTYTPAQIRAAYGMPTLTNASVIPTAAQAAQMGAGQTIYIVDAMHDPNALAELNAFNQKFGLPLCTAKAITSTATLPLAKPALTDGCSLSVVYSTPAGGMTAAAPAYNASWATEIALDVQWAHATAPLARIVLIESADASLAGLAGAIKLANAMGSGAVSMSFGAGEGSWTASLEPTFTGTGMTYLAASGDSGSGVSWPAVSPSVLAVGGTSLTYSGTGSRSESAWSLTGGGISGYTAKPAYQAAGVPGITSLAGRAVVDVSFNANPSTGQFVAIMTPGSTAVNWVSAGGTSLSTPQWAGLIAVANAVRAQTSKTALGLPHPMLYTQLATVPGSYAASFGDVSTGANGTCATCAAKVGYDIPTGLGTPNVTSLLTALGATASAPVSVAPVVAAATVNGKVGTALSYAVTLTAGTANSYALAGAPSGMTISGSGVVSWATPIAGTYAVTVTATNTATGLKGSATLSIVIAKAQPPVITAAALTGTTGKPLSGSIQVSSPSGSALSVSISGIPAGISLSASGQTISLYWAKPVKGSYSLAITAKDATGLTSQATQAITIN